MAVWSKGFFSVALLGVALSPAVLEGCSSSGSNPLCCTEFKVGAQVDANIGGSASSQVAVQAIADIGGIASAAIDDLTSACRGIATDLGATDAEQTTANGAGDKNKVMSAWCDLAVSKIGTAKGSATLTATVVPPKCEASVSAKLDCQAKCSGSASCDIKANPPKCEGGKLTVDCKGGCTASAGATVSCTGSCSGNCQGSCTAQGGVAVDCEGKCDGTCAAGGSASGSGIQADGSCKGTCQGTCTASATAPAVKCSGSCNGSCSATCQGSATASVKCDGKCDADYTPLTCSGGTLSGGCQVEAKCDANCNGSVKAKASCTPAQIDIKASADGLVKLIDTLKAHMAVVLELKTRFQAMADITGNLTGNISAVTDIKAACIPPLVAATAQAVQDISDSVSVTVKLSGQIGQ